jgi:hypothetical protein
MGIKQQRNGHDRFRYNKQHGYRRRLQRLDNLPPAVIKNRRCGI